MSDQVIQPRIVNSINVTGMALSNGSGSIAATHAYVLASSGSGMGIPFTDDSGDFIMLGVTDGSEGNGDTFDTAFNYSQNSIGIGLSDGTGTGYTVRNDFSVRGNAMAITTISAGNGYGGLGSHSGKNNTGWVMVWGLLPSPIIIAQPASQGVTNGSNPTFSVEASSATPMTYQWYSNGVAIIGETNANFALTNVSRANEGNYRVDISNFYGTTQSGIAALLVNDAPVAAEDAFAIDEDTTLTVSAAGVLATDSDFDSDALSAVLVAGPAHGALTLNSDGSFSFTPAANWNGTDAFTYQANDGRINSATATVTLNVVAVNDVPLAASDSYSTPEDVTLAVSEPGVLANDSDVEGPLSAVLVNGPTHGSLTLNTDGSFGYTPESNWHGEDNFTYKAADGSLESAPVTVALTVNSVNDFPIAIADSFSTEEDTMLTISGPGVLANDSDVDSSLIAKLVVGTANGSVELNTDGSFTYTPNANFNGTDSFMYIASDDTEISDKVTVTITVNSVNDAPVAAMLIAAQAGVYGTAFSLTLDAGTFSDVDGDGLSYSALGLPSGINFDGLSRTFSGTPTDAGDYLVQVVASDDQSPALTVTNQFTVTVAKAPLTITADSKNRVYGSANPELTFAYSGFVAGDDASTLDALPTISTEATSVSPIGSYDITLAGASDDNYEITLVNSTLTVGQAAIVVTADPQTRLYGAANPALTGTLSGVLNGDNITATYTTAATSASAVGTYDIAPLFSDQDGKLGNYTVTTNLGTLTVTKAALIVTADNQTRAYGQLNPTLTVSYGGFVNGDTAASLTTAPSCATTATETSSLGSYPIVPSGAASENYTISHVNGTLTVTKAPLLVLGDNASRPYGQANPVFTAVITGVMNGDNISARFSTTAGLLSPPEEYRIALNINDPDGKLGQYNVTLKSGTLTVTPAELIGTVASVSRIYGQPNPAFTVTYSGLMNGEDTSALSGTLAFSCLDTNGTATDTNSSVGSYPIEVISGQTAANYAVQYVPGTMTVTTAELIVTADNASRTYGAINPAFTGTLVGVQNSEDITATFATAATPASNVGNYDIGPVFSDADGKLGNYTITTNLGTLTVGQAALTVTVDNQTRLYGQANPTLTGSLAGVQNGDNLGVDYTTEAGLLSAVGSYPIAPVFGNPDGKLVNYTVSINSGILSVTPATLAATVNNTSRSYGETNPDFNVTYTGFVNREDSSIVTGSLTFSCLDTNGTAVDTNSPVGLYPVLVAVGQTAPNYNIAYVGGELTVTQAVLTVMADNKGRAFGDTNPPFTAVITGYKNGEGASVLQGELAFACTADATSSIGDYAITPSGLTADNYSITYADGTLTVGKAVIVVTADPQTRTYGDANPTLTVTYTGFVNGEDATVLSGAPALSTTADNFSPVGNYAITAAQGSLSAANYAFSFVDGSVAVTRKALTVTGDDASRLYGEINPTFTASFSGFVNGEDATALAGTLSVTSVADVGSPVGTYAIVPAGLTSANYDIAFVNSTLAVNPAMLFVAAENQTRVYGAENPMLTGIFKGVVNNDNITTSFTTAATAASPVGDYEIAPLFSDPDGKLGNYSITTNLGTLTITKGALIVTADNQSRAYGQPNPLLTMSYSGFVNGDTAASLNTAPSCATVATATSTLGSYPIVPSGAASDNYTISYVNGTLTVTKAPLLVLGDNASRPYGQANPAFTAVITGIMNGDNIAPIFSTEATVTSVPRRYDIEIWLNDPDSKLGQYDVTMIGGQLTVTRAILIGTVQNQTRSYGEKNAPFSVSYSGFANGEDTSILLNSLSYSCQSGGSSVNSGSPVGEYAISVTTGQTAANYTVQYVNGTLAITPAALTVTGNDASRVYGAANPTLTTSFSGFVNGEDASALGGTLAVNTTATAGSPVGSYPVTPSGLTSANYSIACVDGALSVTPAELAGKVDDVSRGYGDTNPVFTVSYSGFVNGDDSNVVSGASSFSCVDTDDVAVDTNTPVGVYPIAVVLGQTASNYSISFADGTLTVTQAVLTVAADAKSRTYGTDNPEFTGTITGLVNSDPISASYDTAATPASPAGTYPIVPTLVDAMGISSNYSVTLINGTLTVTADDPPVITLSTNLASYIENSLAVRLDSAAIVTDGGSLDFDGGALMVSLTANAETNDVLSVRHEGVDAGQIGVSGNEVSIGGIVFATFTGGDGTNDLVFSLNTNATPAVASALLQNITYSSTSELPSTNARTAQFVISDGDGGTSAPVALTIEVTATLDDAPITWANPQAITYGVALSEAQLNAISSVPGGFTFEPVLGTMLHAGADQVLTAVFTPDDLVNYNVTTSRVSLTVLKAPLTVTADDKSREYATENPALTISYSGFVNGDSVAVLDELPTASINTTTNSAAGAYPIALSGGTDNDYELVFVNGTLTVERAPLLLIVNDAARTYGQPNPSFTGTILFNLNGDLFTASYSTPATASSGAGSYPITGAVTDRDEKLANYDVVVVDGLLTIGKATLIATADDKSRTYGTSNPELTLSYAGFVNGDSAPALDAAPAINTAPTAESPVGSYPITLTGGSDDNYVFVLADGTLAVTKAPLTIAADNKSKVYGSANPELTMSCTGFVNGDSATVLDSPPAIATSAETMSAVGTYAITLSDGSDDNYELTLVNGTLTIIAAAIHSRCPA